MGTRPTTLSPSFGELINLLLAGRDPDGEKVVWVLADECRGTWEFHFLRVCSCLRRGSPWNCELHRGRPDQERYPNSSLVCLDRQLFLCTTPTEGALWKGEHMENPHPVTFLTGVSGRVPGNLHLHPGCCHGRVFGQHFRYTFGPRCLDSGCHPKAVHNLLYCLRRRRFHPHRAVCQPTRPRLGLCGCRVMRSLWYVVYRLHS